jgi:exo-1,4-beta-D-glucosaminidase
MNLPHGRHLPLPVAALTLTLSLLPIVSCREAPEQPSAATVDLKEGWKILSWTETAAAGSTISGRDFDTSGWTSSSLPSTVLAALVGSGEIQDPYFARNLEKIPVERFAAPWWYRTEFSVGSRLPSSARLVFEGINYSADVWLNGEKVGTRDDLVGAFRIFDLDITPQLTAGTNVLAVEVHPPKPGDPTIGFVDWNPTPPDRNMGLWRGVKLRLTGEVSLDDLFVQSDLDVASLSEASLTLSANLVNRSNRPVIALVAGTIDDAIAIEHEVVLEPQEKRELVFSPREFPQLALSEPRLWWPNNLGEPNLYTLEMSVAVEGRVTDTQEVTFGIRHVEDYFTEEGYRGYAINGKKVLVRGGGWVDDMLLADDDQRLEDQIRYVKEMNLNTIRLEGFWGNSQTLFDLADRYGILVMVGWSCQWEWEEYLGGPVDEFGGIDTPEEMALIARSLSDQVVWLRNHPSVFVWVLASDMLPRPELEGRYYARLQKVDPTRPTLASCAVDTSEVSGPSGVKMNGPYDWVSPNYWYADRQRGSAYGFNTESGPGPQPPPVESIRRMLPEENWWPVDEMWEYHCGRNEFNTLNRYYEALEARYGKVEDLEGFARIAQVANYEGMRAMFESFSIRRPSTTGIIQWMLNSAWPEMYWQLYDHYLVPNGAFYGAQHANRPVNIAYDYADGGIVVVNDTTEPLEGVTARVRVFDLQSEILFETSQTMDVEPETLHRVFSVPSVSPDEKTYFIDGRIEGADGALLASSLYWLSTEEDVLDWEASKWFVTPMARYADLTGLNALPETAIEVEHGFEPTENGQAIHITLSNFSDRLAFFIELKVLGSESGRLAAPVFWDDNYVSLMPGEHREVRGTIPSHALGGEQPVFRYAGLNVEG